MKTITFTFFYMLYSIKDREHLKKLNELVSLQSQVKLVRLQDNLGKQNFHEDIKKVFEPVTKPIKDVSEEVTETKTDSSIKINEASYLMSPLSKITNPETSTQFKIVKDSS